MFKQGFAPKHGPCHAPREHASPRGWGNWLLKDWLVSPFAPNLVASNLKAFEFCLDFLTPRKESVVLHRGISAEWQEPAFKMEICLKTRDKGTLPYSAYKCSGKISGEKRFDSGRYSRSVWTQFCATCSGMVLLQKRSWTRWSQSDPFQPHPFYDSVIHNYEFTAVKRQHKLYNDALKERKGLCPKELCFKISATGDKFSS